MVEFKIGGKYLKFKDKMSVSDYNKYQRKGLSIPDLPKVQFVVKEFQKVNVMEDGKEKTEKLDILMKRLDPMVMLDLNNLNILLVQLACPEFDVDVVAKEDFDKFITSEDGKKWMMNFIPKI